MAPLRSVPTIDKTFKYKQAAVKLSRAVLVIKSDQRMKEYKGVEVIQENSA